jgi:transposase InsO family protein
MKYECIDQLQRKAEAVASLCRLLDVSQSGYYAARRRARQPVKVCAVTTRLQASFAASGRSYGSRRLRLDLRERGIHVGRYRVRTLMRINGMRPVWKRKFIHTTDSRHTLPIADNVLDRQFKPAAANMSWVADITYIRTRSGWLYLAAVMDLFSRKIVGWAMAPSMPAELVCAALQMAIAQRNPPPGLIVHSDRGSQYASETHRALLTRHGLRASMSRKGNCWDNAVMERFFLNLKMERVWQRDYANRAEAIRDVADYIVGFYNNVRLHSTLGYLPPNSYELKSAAKSPIDVSEIT